MTERLNKRQLAKAATREKVLKAARDLWAEPGSYERGTIRQIAQAAGMSTGAIFANFKGKADLWAAALETDHVVGDGVLARAAPELFLALQQLLEVRPEIPRDEDPFATRAWQIAEALADRVNEQLLEEEARRAGSAKDDASSAAVLDVAA